MMIKTRSKKTEFLFRLPFLCLLGLMCTLMACDKKMDKTTKGEVFTIVEQMPHFPNGDEALLQFFGSNIKYPEAAKKDHIQGVVVLEFIVEKDGSISNLKIIRDIGGGCGEEAIRVTKQMPKWSPGRQAGKAVRASFKIPVRFKLE